MKPSWPTDIPVKFPFTGWIVRERTTDDPVLKDAQSQWSGIITSCREARQYVQLGFRCLGLLHAGRLRRRVRPFERSRTISRMQTQIRGCWEF